jgi:hypothetical protein
MVKLIIQVENVKDMLIQRDWVNYIEALEMCICEFSTKVFFNGRSRMSHTIESVVWVIEYNEVQTDRFIIMLREIEALNKMKNSITLNKCTKSYTV